MPSESTLYRIRAWATKQPRPVPDVSGCKRNWTDAQTAQLKALQGTVAQLQEQLAAARKNSSTSSKPPSSDIVKPAKPVPPGPTTPRPPVDNPVMSSTSVSSLNRTRSRKPSTTDSIAAPIVDTICDPTGFDPRVVQQVDLPEIVLSVKEHRQHEGYCCRCDKVHHAALPLPVQRGGLLGPRLTTLVASLKSVAEQAIRFVVIDRHITQGTRSDGGQRWCERIWTLLATCTQQGRSVWDYLQAVVEAYFNGTTPPPLLPEAA